VRQRPVGLIPNRARKSCSEQSLEQRNFWPSLPPFSCNLSLTSASATPFTLGSFTWQARFCARVATSSADSGSCDRRCGPALGRHPGQALPRLRRRSSKYTNRAVDGRAGQTEQVGWSRLASEPSQENPAPYLAARRPVEITIKCPRIPGTGIRAQHLSPKYVC